MDENRDLNNINADLDITRATEQESDYVPRDTEHLHGLARDEVDMGLSPGDLGTDALVANQGNMGSGVGTYKGRRHYRSETIELTGFTTNEIGSNNVGMSGRHTGHRIHGTPHTLREQTILGSRGNAPQTEHKEGTLETIARKIGDAIGLTDDDSSKGNH